METKELWMDEEFCKKVDAASDTEEIIRLFAEKGVTVTAEQIASVKAAQDGELDEAALDGVAGGCVFCRVGGWFVYLVVRCGGGDRDAGKRPIMGEIAARLSDQVIVTSDNPRTENPQAIVDAIMQGVQAVPGADQRTMAVVDRREAIHRAVFAADAKDIILVAGKGHECEQILNDGPHHFVDGEVLREAFNECRAVRSRK